MQEERVRLAFENGDSSSFGTPGWRNEWCIHNLASKKNMKDFPQDIRFQFSYVMDRLNPRPSKSLDWATPSKVHFKAIRPVASRVIRTRATSEL